MTKTLVLYVFHEYNKLVKYFIENAIFKDDDTDFIIICNNKDIDYEAPDYVERIWRENKGYDFGGWSEGLFVDDNYKKYDYYIFVNSSVIGPFLPSYYKNKWTQVYIDGLNEEIKLFGSTINCEFNPYTAHVQSYIFSMTKETLQYLIDEEIFSLTKLAPTYERAIWDKEVLMSRKLVDKGWNFSSLLPYYNGIDFTFNGKKPEGYRIKYQNDLMNEKYRGKLWNLHQLVFVKGNRISLI